MCCRYYYADFETELRELMKAVQIVELPGLRCGGSDNTDTCLSQNGVAIRGAERGESGGKNRTRDIRPSQAGVVIHGVKSLNGSNVTDGNNGMLGASDMVWGFTGPAKKGLIINARAETAREKIMFADSIAKRRCVIPASGFYEWDPYKARYRFTSPEGGLLLIAGFYRKEQGVPRFTVLTTEANDSMIKVHDRMPVMIGRDEIRPWIEDDAELDHFLGRKQARLVCEQDSGQMTMSFLLQ